MEYIKGFLIILFSFFVGSGTWYLLFWFFTMEPNMFAWSLGTKVIYVILAYISSGSVMEFLLKD